MPNFLLQYDPVRITELAAKYMATPYKTGTAADADREMEEAGRCIVNGVAIRQNLEKVYRWKSARRMDLFVLNTGDEISQAVTGAILSKAEKKAIESLTHLKGVGVKMASAILTAMFPELYTVCDFRASEALGVNDGNDVNFYVAYLKACREMSKKYAVTLRDLDRANWQWSKDRTKKSRSEKHRCL
jgi:hypothetical protein